MPDYLHLLPFFSWMPLILLAGTQKRRAVAGVLWTLSGVTLLLCGYELYLDFVWSRTVVAPIRVDLVLLIPLATITFTIVGLWGLLKPGAPSKIASIVLLALSVPAALVFAHGIWTSGKDLARLDSRPFLIFEAQFRNPGSFRTFFGNIDESDDPRVGHFQAEDPASWASRAIVNDRGHFWLMFRCRANVECVHSQADLGATSLPGRFHSQAESGPPFELDVPAWSRERFTITLADGRSAAFVRAPVPYRETVSPPGTVVFRGSFSQSRVDRDYVHLVQVWLWQSGDRWLAYYVRRIAMCGSTNDFVFASAYEGRAASDRILFTSEGREQSLEEFELRLSNSSGDRADGQIFYGGKPLEAIALERTSVLHSPVYEVAPLGDFEGTREWLKTVSMGYAFSWRPECH